MVAITAPILAKAPQLRPLNILTDLPVVADLVESCFAGTLDAEGQRYIQQMRRAGNDGYFLRWAANAMDTVSMPLSGYVWEENREVVGNVSLVPFKREGRKIYLIANVAVRLDYRRKGIGRTLTVSAMQHARQRHAQATWLHVRDDNPGAAALYASLGFRERVRRTLWQAAPDRSLDPHGAGITITSRRRATGRSKRPGCGSSIQMNWPGINQFHGCRCAPVWGLPSTAFSWSTRRASGLPAWMAASCWVCWPGNHLRGKLTGSGRLLRSKVEEVR